MNWFGDEYRRENMMLGILAVFALLVAIYALASGQQVHRRDGETAFARSMPENYKPVLAAIIRASGAECDQICDVVVDAPLLQQRVRASCAVRARHVACTAPVTFDITVAPTAEPSR